MKKFLLLSLLFILFPPVAHAATCDAGQYLNNNRCTDCPRGYYCPGNDAVEECPMQISQSALQPAEIEWYENKYGGHTASYYFTSYIMAPYNDTDCYLNIVLQHDNGKQYFRQRYNHRTGHYDNMSTWNCGDGLWGNPSTGYYLSDNPSNCKLGYSRNIYPCTNKPEYSYYTGPGTPDVGNCPWACDAGYGRTAWDTCEPLCTAGITTLRTSNGLIFNLYANKLTSPAVHVRPDGTNTVCYGNLAMGNATGAINLRIGDTVYHTTN